MKWQVIDKTATYKVRKDKLLYNKYLIKDENGNYKGGNEYSATLLSDKDLRKIAEEKELIL